MAIRLLVVDDHEVVRSGVTQLLRESDVEIVGEADNARDAVSLVKKHNPDVVLLDIRLHDVDGLEVLEQLREAAPESRVVCFSNFDNPTYVARANALGATDYILKDASRDQMLTALRAAASGQSPTAEGRLREVAQTMALRKKDTSNDLALTQRETQVLRHLALGLSNKEIGLSLSISIETVKEHVQHLLRKMGVNDRTQAAVWAVKNGLV